MNLKHIANHVLRVDSKKAALKEKETTTYLLHHIKEVDRRKLYCDWKFSSLFDWCVKDLGLCEGSAHLRITAARLLAQMPELERKIEQGALNLSNISQVSQFCRENKIENLDEKKEILKQVECLTKKEAEKKLCEISGKERPSRDKQKRISEKKSQLTITLSNETMDAIDEVKALLGKKVSTDELMRLMASALREKVEKEKFKQVEKPRKSKGTKVSGRVLSAEVKREVYARDKQCVNCGTKHRLNYDHRKAYCMGGDNSVENIRLLCFQCNQRARITSSG